MAVDPDMQMVFTGSNDGEVKAWRVDHDALVVGLVETDTGEVRITQTMSLCTS